MPWYFRKNKTGEDQFFWLATVVPKNGKQKLVVVKIKNAKNETEANQIAYQRMKGNTFQIITTDSNDPSEATRIAKGMRFWSGDNLPDVIDRASHQEEIE